MSRAALLIKRNDKETAPSKEWKGVKHGDPVDLIHDADAGWRGQSLEQILSGRRNYEAYGVVEIDPKQIPEFKKYLVPIEGDEVSYRPRKMRLDISKLQTKCGIVDLDSRLHSGDTIDLINGSELISDDFLDASLLSNEKIFPDIKAIASGTATIGAGGAAPNYATRILFLADLANLTGDLTATQVNVTTEATVASLTEKLAGNTLTITSLPDPLGNWLTGFTSTVTHDGSIISFAQEGPGVTIYKNMKTNRSVASAAANMIEIGTVGVAFTCHIRNSLFDDGAGGAGIRGLDPTPILLIYNNIFINTTTGLRMDTSDGNVSSIYAFNSITGAAVGTRMNSNPGTMISNAFLGNTLNYHTVTGITGRNNASSSADGANGDFATGTNNLINLVTADQWKSLLAAGGDDFLLPKETGSLFGNAIASGIPGHTTGINGLPLLDIGAKQLSRASGGIPFFFNSKNYKHRDKIIFPGG